MFRGSTPLALDGKGGLAIPTRHRDALAQRCGGRLVVTLDPSNCLSLYPFPDWEPIEQKLNGLSSFNPLYARLRRSIVGNAIDLDMDSAGRILVPAGLRDKARLEKEVMLVGQGNKFELWDEVKWAGQQETELSFANGELPKELEGFTL